MTKAKQNKHIVKLICNPESGDPQDPTSRLQEVTRLIAEQGFEVHVALAKPKERAEKIAQKAVKKGYRRIAVLGGDGTIEAVARAIVGSKAQLAILPGGTENNLVKSLGIPDNLEEAVALLCTGKAQKIDVGQIKTTNGRKFYFLELAVMGLVAAIYPNAKKIPKGDLSGLKEVVGEFLNYKMPKITLTLEDESKIDAESMLVTVMNAPAFGKTFLMAPDASMQDGLLDVSVFANLSKGRILAYFAAVSNGGESGETGLQRYRASKITIKGKPAQQVMADGVLLGKGKVKIKARRHALRVILGKQEGLARTEPASDAQALPIPIAAPPPPTEDTPSQSQDGDLIPSEPEKN